MKESGLLEGWWCSTFGSNRRIVFLLLTNFLRSRSIHSVCFIIITKKPGIKFVKMFHEIKQKYFILYLFLPISTWHWYTFMSSMTILSMFTCVGIIVHFVARCTIFVTIWKIVYIKDFPSMLCQGLLEFIWTEGYSGQSSNPGLALAIIVLLC